VTGTAVVGQLAAAVRRGDRPHRDHTATTSATCRRHLPCLAAGHPGQGGWLRNPPRDRASPLRLDVRTALSAADTTAPH
jgi:hypothetical protein